MFLPPSPPISSNFNNFRTSNINQSSSSSGSRSISPYGIWEKVEIKQSIGSIPCQRSLHAGAVLKDNFIVFGG